MAPSFSKIPVAAISGIPVISGLMCSHADCYALFSNLEDSEEHAVLAHTGNVTAVTCGIYEGRSKSGKIRLYRVIDDDEDDTQNEHLVPPPTQSVVANSRENISDDKLNDTTGKNANEQLRTAIVQVISTPLASEETLPSTQQELSPLIPTPPCSQPPPSDLESSDPVSRQSTLSTMGVTLSSSSLSSNDVAAEDEDSVLHRVLAVAQEATDQCRVCWVSREKSRPHATFRCPTRICSSREWQVFKSDLRFPPGAVCYFCLAPYGPPFNHARAAPGVRQSPELCEYPDVLKELVYIIYQDEVLREKVFSTLGVNAPSTLYLYKRYITKEQDEGIFGAYKVVNAYLDVRQAEGLSSHHHASR